MKCLMPYQKAAFFTVSSLFLLSCGNPAIQPDATMTRSASPAVQELIDVFTQSCLETAPAYEEAAVKARFEQATASRFTLLSFVPGQKCDVYVGQHTPANGIPTHGDLVAMARSVQSRIGGTINAPSGFGIRVEGGTADVSISANTGGDNGLRFAIRN